MSFGRTRNGAPFSRLEITFHLWWEGCPEGPRELDRFKVFSRKWNGREKRPVSTRDVTGLLDHRPRRRVHLRTTILRKGSRATIPRTVVDRGGRGAVWPPCPTERSDCPEPPPAHSPYASSGLTPSIGNRRHTLSFSRRGAAVLALRSLHPAPNVAVPAPCRSPIVHVIVAYAYPVVRAQSATSTTPRRARRPSVSPGGRALSTLYRRRRRRGHRSARPAAWSPAPWCRSDRRPGSG